MSFNKLLGSDKILTYKNVRLGMLQQLCSNMFKVIIYMKDLT